MPFYQSYQGPADIGLKRSEIEGLQPVSRIGEVVVNAFVDAYEWNTIKNSLPAAEVNGTATYDADGKLNPAHTDVCEVKPHFHEWASVLPGMICVSRKARSSTFRNYAAAETAVPVIACAAGIPHKDMKDYYFAGICRSKSVRQMHDGRGPTEDEFFTLFIGGMATIQNNSSESVFPGDMVGWTLYSEGTRGNADSYKRQRTGSTPRRFGIEIVSSASERVFGRCLTFAKPGEPFDVLLSSY